MIDSKLKEFDYYKSKIPMYLQNDDAFIEHFKIWFDLLTSDDKDSSVDNVADRVFDSLNIMSDDYVNYMTTNGYIDFTSTKSDILDKIASLFGVSRYVDVEYNTTSLVKETLILNNLDLLTYIRFKVLINDFNGTNLEFAQLYASILSPYKIFVEFYNTDPATLNVYFIKSGTDTGTYTNIQKMILSNLFTINIMGVITESLLLSEDKVQKILYWHGENVPSEKMYLWYESPLVGGIWAL